VRVSCMIAFGTPRKVPLDVMLLARGIKITGLPQIPHAAFVVVV